MLSRACHPRSSSARFAVLGALTASLAVAPGAGAASRSAPRAGPVTPGSGYLSIGDSVTFGYQEPQVVPAPNYRNPSSFLGYPERSGS